MSEERWDEIWDAKESEELDALPPTPEGQGPWIWDRNTQTWTNTPKEPEA